MLYGLLRFNSVKGLDLWVDGDPVKPQRDVTLDLKRGRHQLTLAVRLDTRKSPLRCEVADVEGSPARVQVVGGK